MSEEILCTARTRDELAKCFAEEVAKQYRSHLEFWQATAVDDKEEYECGVREFNMNLIR